MKLQNFAENQWIAGDGDGRALTSAVDGRMVATITSDGIDFGAMLEFARRIGGTNLRRYTFHDRAFMLKVLAKYLMEQKEQLYKLSCLLYTSPSPRDRSLSRMPSSA